MNKQWRQVEKMRRTPMKFWWIFGFQWWGNMRPAAMVTKEGKMYIPWFLGIWTTTG